MRFSLLFYLKFLKFLLIFQLKTFVLTEVLKAQPDDSEEVREGDHEDYTAQINHSTQIRHTHNEDYKTPTVCVTQRPRAPVKASINHRLQHTVL